MQWLLHAPLAAPALARHGHKTHELAELALAADAGPTDLLHAAQAKQWDVITADAKMAMMPFDEDYYFKRSIVYLQLPAGPDAMDAAVDRLFARFSRLTPGRLYTVTANRVKVRQLPASRSGL